MDRNNNYGPNMKREPRLTQVSDNSLKSSSSFLLHLIAKIPVLTKKQEYDFLSSMHKKRNAILSEILEVPQVFSSVRDEINKVINQEPIVWNKLHTRHTLNEILYLNDDEVKKFEKKFIKYNKRNEEDNLIALFQKKEFSVEYSNRIIDLFYKHAQKSYTPSRNLELMLKLYKSDKDKMALHNLKLVYNIAKSYSRSANQLEVNDLFQAGIEGLLVSIRKVEYRMGNKFSTFAVYWIKQAIGDYIQHYDRTIRLPVRKINDINKFLKARSELLSSLEREPFDNEIADMMRLNNTISPDITGEEVRDLKEQSQSAISIANPIGFDVELGDLIPDSKADDPENIVVKSMDFKKIMGFLEKKLTEKEYKVLKRRYLHEETLQQVSDELKLTRERIRQIGDMALRKARIHLVVKGFNKGRG